MKITRYFIVIYRSVCGNFTKSLENTGGNYEKFQENVVEILSTSCRNFEEVLQKILRKSSKDSCAETSTKFYSNIEKF